MKKSMQSRDMDMKATAEVIVWYKGRNGLSVAELAEAAGCSQQTVRRWLRGESLPNGGNMDTLAELFGVYPEDLVCFRDFNEEVE